MAQERIVDAREAVERTIRRLEADADKLSRKPGRRSAKAVRDEVERFKDKRAGM